MRSHIIISAAVVMVLTLSASAYQRTLIEMRSLPPLPPWRASWDGANLSVTSQGLPANSDFNFSAVPGAHVDAYGKTSFDNITFQVSGLAASDIAAVNPVYADLTVISQPLGAATISIWANGPAGEQTLLLHGTATDAVIVGLQGHRDASLQSTTVLFDSGVMYDWLHRFDPWSDGMAAIAAWGISNIDAADGIQVGPTGVLSPFSADSDAGFFFTPEPATIGLLAFAALALLRRSPHGTIVASLYPSATRR